MEKIIKSILITAFCLTLSACNKYKNYYKIECENPVIGVDEIYQAKIFLLKTDDIDPNTKPVFYFISSKADTFYLPYDADRYCAIYRSTGKNPGKYSWSGIFEYKTKDKKTIKIPVSDTYLVK